MIKNVFPLGLPNTISLLRVVLSPVVVWLVLTQSYGAAFWVFVLAAASDGLDGALARMRAEQSHLGTYLDPVADKVLVVSVFGALAYMGRIPLWLIAVVVVREIVVVGVVALALALHHRFAIQPGVFSKLNTVVLMAVPAWLLGVPALGWKPLDIMPALFWGVAGLTAASALLMLGQGIAVLRDDDGLPPPPPPFSVKSTPGKEPTS